MSERRELAAALGCVVAGAATVLIAVTRTWVEATASQGSLRAPLRVSGSSLAPAVGALAVCGLAGALALLVSRGVWRAAIGAAIAGFGTIDLVLVVARARPGAGSLTGRAGAALGSGSAQVGEVSFAAWPWLAAVGALVLVVGGALATLRGRRWPGLSARYELPRRVPTGPAAPTGRDDGALQQWRALDRGEDPTL